MISDNINEFQLEVNRSFKQSVNYNDGSARHDRQIKRN